MSRRRRRRRSHILLRHGVHAGCRTKASDDQRGRHKQLAAPVLGTTSHPPGLGGLPIVDVVNIRSRRGVYIVRKSKAEVLETITVWAALESMAARLACTAASDAELGELNQMVDSFSADTVQDHMTEYSDANIRFHGSIIRLSKCDLIAQMTDSLFIHVRAIRHRTIFEKDRGERSVEDHREIVDALQKREQDEASRLVREHAMKLHEHVRLYVDLD